MVWKYTLYDIAVLAGQDLKGRTIDVCGYHRMIPQGLKIELYGGTGREGYCSLVGARLEGKEDWSVWLSWNDTTRFED